MKNPQVVLDRVAIVAPVPPIRGGVAQHSARLIAALREAGKVVDVVSWRAQYPVLLFGGSQQRPRSDADTWFGLRWWSPVSWWRGGMRIRGADILVLPWVTPAHSLAFWVITKIARAQSTVMIVHNVRPHEAFPFADVLFRAFARQSDGAVAHSEAVRRDIARVDSSVRISVVEHPPNINMRVTKPPEFPPVRILLPGYVRRYKGVDNAIRAIGILISRGWDVTLTVAGEFWTSLPELEALAESLGVAGQVDLIDGFVEDRLLDELFEAHHLVLLPYRSATQSGFVPMAKAAARPVVVSRVGGLAEFVGEAAGCVARSSEPVDLVDAIVDCIAGFDSKRFVPDDSSATWAQLMDAILELASHESSPEPRRK